MFLFLFIISQSFANADFSYALSLRPKIVMTDTIHVRVKVREECAEVALEKLLDYNPGFFLVNRVGLTYELAGYNKGFVMPDVSCVDKVVINKKERKR